MRLVRSKFTSLLIVAMLATLLAPIAFQSPAAAAAGDCTGVVFRDHNADGQRQAQGDMHPNGVDAYDAEPGEAGVTVTAYDDTGAAVGTTTTLADGTFDLSTTVPAGTDIRIEFTWPSLTHLTSGPNGVDNASSVQFATVGSCNVSFGVMNPADYCQDTVHLAVPCYVPGASGGAYASEYSLVSVEYDWGFDAPVNNGPLNWGNWATYLQVDEAGVSTPPVAGSTHGEVGSVWGLAWNRADDVMFGSAVTKAGSDYGPGGPGAIYSIPMDTTTGTPSGAATVFADLGALGMTMCDDPHSDADLVAIPPSTTETLFAAVGTCGIGDIDISDDSSTLYAMNLSSREIAVLDASSGALLDSWPMIGAGLDMGSCPDPAVDFRPWALEYHDGKLYAGAVCTAGSTQDEADLAAYVYEIDPATGAMTLALDYQITDEHAMFNPWLTSLAMAGSAPNLTFGSGPGWSYYGAYYAQPILTDIEFYNNDLTLGFTDIFGHQFADSSENLLWDAEIGDTGLWRPSGTGDVVCAAFVPDAADPTTGTYTLEAGDTCGSRVSGSPNGTYGQEQGAGDNAGLEFYVDGGGFGGTSHEESHLGAFELVPGRPLVQTITNPAEALGQDSPTIRSSAGLLWNNNTDGTWNRGYTLYRTSNAAVNGFGKSNGLGDIESLCEEAPLEIGNYVWYDADGDGIQDPSEAPVAGATVNLYDSAGNLVATTTTGPDGSYYFDVDPNTDYVIRMDNPADYAAGGPLEDWAPTVDSADGDDDGDSDGVTGADGYPEIVYTSGEPGENDHTLDFGFSQIFDLALFKTLADGTNTANVMVGDTVTFTITVINQGAVDATDVEVVDYGPAGLTFVSDNAAAVAATDTLGNPVVVTSNGSGGFTLSALDVGDQVEIDVSYTVDAGATGTLDNFAEISGANDADGNPGDDVDSTPDADDANDTGPATGGDTDDDNVSGDATNGEDEDDHDVASITVVPTPEFDLALIKQLADGTNLGTVMPGDTVTFTLTITNQGDVDATAVGVADYVPAGLTLADAAWTETAGVAELNTPIPALAAGASTTVDITFTVDAGATGTLDNFAEISGANDADGNPGDDIDSTPDSTPGDTGPSTAGDADDDNVADDGLAGEDEDDHDVASLTVTDAPIFDLALIKQLADGTNVGTVMPGSTVTFTLTITNQGTVDATDIAVADYVPAGLTLADADWTDNAGVAELNTPIPALAAGGSTTVDITFTVDAGATGTLDNFAEVSAANDADGNPGDDIDSTPDSTPGDTGPTTGGDADDDNVADDGLAGEDEDDHDVASLVVDPVDPDPVFDLALIKQLADGTNTGSAAPGDGVTFTITVTNQGDVDAMDITIAEYVPAGLTLADANWTDTGNGMASISLPGTLAAGTSTTVDISFTVDAGVTGTLNNFAEISGANDPDGNPGDDVDSTPDADGTNDMGPATGGDTDDDNVSGDATNGEDEDDHDVATVAIPVVDPAAPVFDLALFKTLANGANNASVNVGDSVTFTITVINQGNVDAVDVTVADYLPTGLTLADADWTDAGNGTATIALPGTLAAGTSTTVDITFTVDSGATGAINNFAEIGSATAVDVLGTALTNPDGTPLLDIDSIPDANNDDTFNNDDDTTQNGATGDEDDHDRAQITVRLVSPPTNTTLALTGNNNGLRLVVALAFLLLSIGTALTGPMQDRRKHVA